VDLCCDCFPQNLWITLPVIAYIPAYPVDQ